jgi:hypothetical protein
MTTPKPRLRFRLCPKETGLRAIGAGPRGWDLLYGDLCIGGVSPIGGGWGGPVTGWYWVASEASVGVPWCNTCHTPSATPEEAKAACMAYVRECLSKFTCRAPTYP